MQHFLLTAIDCENDQIYLFYSIAVPFMTNMHVYLYDHDVIGSYYTEYMHVLSLMCIANYKLKVTVRYTYSLNEIHM